MKKNKDKNIRVHFIGIGGIGMSGLARYFLAHKWKVSGSDAAESSMTKELKNDGIAVTIGHKAKTITRDIELIIYNRAIPSNNPELIAAYKNKKAVVLPYAKALGRITEDYETIAITGSHGKSTTTALAGLTLMRGGLDPTILVGTKLADLKDKNIRMGKGPYLVLEADDYGAAFLEYSPAISIVTNIDKEHMDFYKNFANVKKTFLRFLSKTRPGGFLILNADDAPLFSLKDKVASLAVKNHLNVIWYGISRMPGDAKKIKRANALPGQHNVSNALAVMQLGKILRIPQKDILAGLAAYKGAWRRMEYRGAFSLAGIKPKVMVSVFDDYAHHPTEIKATLAAFKEKFSHTPLVCVFQPHQAKRLELLFKEFMAAFDSADMVFILPLYKVLGRDEKLPHDSRALVRAIEKRSLNKPIFYVHDRNTIKEQIEAVIRDQHTKSITKPSSPILIMMGAGDIADLTKKILS